MAFSTLLLGSVGVLAETSHLRRLAFNDAFTAQGLGWSWDSNTYAELLRIPGGKARLAAYAERMGAAVDVNALYQVKMDALEARVEADGLQLRAGVGDLIAEARAQGMKIAFCGDAASRQVALLFKGLGRSIDAALFDYIGNADRAARRKPAPDIYHDALRELDVRPRDAVAIEDMPHGVEAALAAGLTTWAYPGPEAMHMMFPDGAQLLRDLSPALLRSQAA